MNADRYVNVMDDLKKYIDQNSAQSLNRKILANKAGYSVPHFHRIFTTQTGENIVAYLRRIRLERSAHKLMMGAIDLMQIAMSAGYQSHSAFSKAFKAYYGYTPSQFRSLNFLIAIEVIKKGKPKSENKTD